MRLIPFVALFVAVAPATAQDYHFTREMSPGSRLSISNINGNVTVVQSRGRTAEIDVEKTVKRGDGDMVKAILETTDAGVRVCTIYLNQDRNRDTCRGNNSNNDRYGSHFEVDMRYTVRVPAGVELAVDNVNGYVRATGLDNRAKLETVNGDVIFEGGSSSSLETVNGNIRAAFSGSDFDDGLKVETVNGNVDLSFPQGMGFNVRGETVNGGIDNGGMPITIEGKWGPKSFSGKVGRGGPLVSIETVNGGITLRRRGDSMNSRDNRDDRDDDDDRDQARDRDRRARKKP